MRSKRSLQSNNLRKFKVIGRILSDERHETISKLTVSILIVNLFA